MQSSLEGASSSSTPSLAGGASEPSTDGLESLALTGVPEIIGDAACGEVGGLPGTPNAGESTEGEIVPGDIVPKGIDGEPILPQEQTSTNDDIKPAAETNPSANTSTASVPSGSAYIDEVGDSVSYSNTATSNAIQTAINNALSKAAADQANITEYTVVVKDGTYDKGLSITKDYTETVGSETVNKQYSLNPSFVLYIKYSGLLDSNDLASASNGAVLVGDITIKDIKVVIAGLYLAEDNKVNVTDAESFTFYGTTEEDKASFTLNDVAASSIDLGAGNDTATVTYAAEKLDLETAIAPVSNVTGNDGDDNISVNLYAAKKTATGDVPTIVILGGAGNDTLTIAGPSSGEGETAFSIAGEAGDDLINLDTTVHFATTLVNVSGGEGSDKLNLTGSLATQTVDGVEKGMISGIASDLLLTAKSSVRTDQLRITSDGIEAYTDQLKNKTKVTLSSEDEARLVYSEALKSFTDYVLEASTIVKVIFEDTTDVLFSNLKLAAGNIYYLFARELNVLDTSKNILVGGSDTITASSLGVDRLGIFAKNITLIASDTDTVKVTIPGTSFISGEDISFEISFFDAKTDAFVTIADDATLDATQSIQLEAASSQTKPFFPVAAINVVDVKVGNAAVRVNGILNAGSTISLAAKGIVKIVADGTTLADLSAVPLPVPIGVPLAISIAFLDIAVDIDGAIITTPGALLINAISDMNVTTKSATGALPLSLSVSVISADTIISIKDSIVKLGGDLVATAQNSTIALTTASLPSAAAGSVAKSYYTSGGFFAVSVLMNETKASITGASLIETGGDTLLKTISYEKAETQGISGKMGSANTTSSSTTQQFSFSQITKLLPTIFSKLKGQVGSIKDSNKVSGKLDAAGDSISDEGKESDDEPSGSSDDKKTDSANKIFDKASSSSTDSKSTDGSDGGQGAPSGSSSTGGAPSGVQLVGSVAVTVGLNDTQSFIDTQGTVRAVDGLVSAGTLSGVSSGGDCILGTTGTTIIRTIADASAITKTNTLARHTPSTEATGSETTHERSATDNSTLETSGGTYAAKGASIVVEGGTFKNTGGTIEADKQEGSSYTGTVGITGGTTTITGSVITINGGTITWTGDNEAIIEINRGVTNTVDGKYTTSTVGGLVRVTGTTEVPLTATIEGGKVVLSNATLTLLQGCIYFKNAAITKSGSDDASVFTGGGELSGISGGELTMAAKDASFSAFKKVVVKASDSTGIERIGGTTVTAGPAKYTSMGTKLDRTGNPTITNNATAVVLEQVNFANLKDATGNTVTVTLLTATPAAGSTPATAASEIYASKGNIEITKADLVIDQTVTVEIEGGEKFENETGKTIYKSTDSSKTTTYITGTFALKLFGTLTGATILADGVSYKIGTETKTGNLSISGATLTFTQTGAILNITKGQLKLVGSTVTIGGGGVEVMLGNLSLENMGTIALKPVGASDKLGISGGIAKAVNDPSTAASSSIGVAVAVSVVNHDNKAYISDTSRVSANGLQVTADTKSLSSDTEARAGYASGSIGIGGAVAVNVVSADTSATVAPTAVLALGDGPLVLRSTGVSNFSTIADASNKSNSASSGDVSVGAGIAVAVIGNDYTASIPDGLTITRVDDKLLSKINLTARHSGTEKVEAKAGAAGGTAVTPVLALNVSGATVEASLGSGNGLGVLGNVDLVALNKVIRTLTADASAAGGSVGVGGAFSVTVYNDRTLAKINRSIAAQNIKVNATGVSRSSSTAKAGVSGSSSSSSSGSSGSGGSGSEGGQPSSSEKGESDKQADKAVGAGADLAKNVNSKGISSGSVSGLSANRQTAQTTEGSISVAAAFALDIQKNVVEALIGDGLAFIVVQDMQVASWADTDSALTANGATTNSNIGVGVGVAINIITHENTASIGDSTIITGGNLSVTAQLYDDVTPPKANDDATVLELLQQYIEKMLKQIETATINATGLTGLANLFHGTLVEKLEAKWAELPDLTENEKDLAYQFIMKNAFNAVAMKLGVPGFTFSSSDLKADVQAIAEGILGELIEDIVDTGVLKQWIQGNYKEIINTFVNTSLNSARNALFGWLCAAFGSPASGPANTIKTYAIAGAGASDVGVAGAAAIAVVSIDTNATIAGTSVLRSGDDIKVDGDAKIIAENVNALDTVATAAVTATGSPDKNKDAEKVANSGTGSQNTTGAGSGSGSGGSGSGSGTGGATTGGSSVGVGAAFALNVFNNDTIASLGTNRKLVALSLEMRSEGEDKVEIYSVAGTDPLADAAGGNPKSIAVDASAAVNIIGSRVHAAVESGALLITTGTDTVTAVEDDEDTPQNESKLVNVLISAVRTGKSLVSASGFAAGDRCAVGAAVAVNVLATEAFANFAGTGRVAGAYRIIGRAYNEDESLAIATAMGSDLARLFSQFANATDTLESWANSLASGNVDLTKKDTSNDDNKTATQVNDTLNKNNNSEDTSDTTKKAATNKSSLSTNVLNTQDAKTTNSPNTQETDKVVKNNTNQTETPNTQTQGGKILVAAAIATNITKHLVESTISGQLEALQVEVLAINNGNYRTVATGVAATLSKATAAVGAAVAVGVNRNTSVARVTGTVETAEVPQDGDWRALVSNAGPVIISATLTENMDGTYAGLLGAQAIAGSVSGAGSIVSVAGALAVLVSRSECIAEVTDDAIIAAGDVDITAYDKTKLAVRAGGIMFSTGTTVGVGASFALVYGHNVVHALVGERAAITAKSLDVQATKAMVTFSDYGTSASLSDLYEIKPSTKKADETDSKITDAKDTALITITPVVETDAATGQTKTTYKIAINVDTDEVLEVIDLLNFLSSTNYYVESIAGAIVSGANSTAAVAGAVAMVFGYNDVLARIGDDCTIKLAGDVNVVATNGTNSRIIAGALSASPATIGVGASIGFLYDEDTVNASIGNGALATSGAFALSADSDNEAMVIVVAPAVTSGAVAVGGTLGVIAMENTAAATVADDATVIADAGISVSARNKVYLLPVTISVAASKNVAVGGTMQTIVTGTKTIARVGECAQLLAVAGPITVGALSSESLIGVLASASASNNAAVAAVINVVVSRTWTQALIGSGAVLRARDKVSIQAQSETFMVSATVSAAGASTAAVGGAVNVFVFDRDVLAMVNNGTATNPTCITSTKGDVEIDAFAKDYAVIVSVGGAGASTAAVSATVPVVVSLNRIAAILGTYDDASTPVLHADHLQINAGGSIGIIANYDTKTYLAAGGFSGAGTAAVGATVISVVVDNDILALVGNYASLAAGGAGAGLTLPNQENRKRGVIVHAKGNETFLFAGVSGSGAGTAAVSGVINSVIITNRVRSGIGDGSTVSCGDDDSEGDLSIRSSDDSNAYIIAGGLAAAGTAGVGATVVTFIYDKQVDALAGDITLTRAHDVSVEATAFDDLFLFALSFSAAGTAAVSAGSNVLYFENDVEALLGGTIGDANDQSKITGDVTVSASSDTHLMNVVAAFAGSGTAAVTGVSVVTYFTATTTAHIADGSGVYALGTVNVLASSHERIDADAAGITGSGVASVSGTVDVIITKVVTKAFTGENVKLVAGTVNINATDSYEVLGIVATAAVSGTAGVGVTALVSVSKNTVNAFIGEDNTITTTATPAGGSDENGNVRVSALAKRNVQIYTATAAGGEVGVGVSIVVVVAGGKLTQDAADQLGGITDEDKGESYIFFDADAVMKDVGVSLQGGTNNEGDTYKGFLGADASARVGDRFSGNTLAQELKGDGVYDSKTQVGSNGEGFDNKSGYVSDDFTSKTGSEDSYDFGSDATINPDNNGDLSDARGKDRALPAYEPQDTTSAWIAVGTVIDARGDIIVSARDLLTADVISASVAGGFYAAVSPGIALAVLYSNVLAFVDEDTILRAGGDVTIEAWSGSQTVNESDITDPEQRAEEQARNAATTKELKLGEALTSRSIRVIAATGGGAIANVNVSVAVITLNNQVRAWLAGQVIAANSLNVRAQTYYPGTLAATVTAGGGFVSVGSSVAIVIAQGVVYAGIVGDAVVGDPLTSGRAGVNEVNVATDTVFSAMTVAATIGGGGVAVNGGVSLAIDRMRVDTFVGDGVYLECVGALSLTAHANMAAKASLINITGGNAAVGISAAVVVLSPTILTYVGTTPLGFTVVDGALGTSKGSITTGSLRIRNDVTSTAASNILAVVAGSVGVAGNVLLVFNDTVNYAVLYRMPVDVLGAISIDAYMDSSAEAFVAAATAGSVAVGITTSVVLLDSDTRAFIDTTGVTMKAGTVAVHAGRDGSSISTPRNYSSATATTIAGNIGAVAVGVNVAIADNNTHNYAQIIGTGILDVATALNVGARGNAFAKAYIIGVNGGGISIAGSVAVAVLRSMQEASVTCKTLYATSLDVTSVLNDAQSYTAVADVLTGGGGVVTVTANIVVAYGRSVSNAFVTASDGIFIGNRYAAGGQGEPGNITIRSTGTGKTQATSSNVASLSKYSGLLILGFSYAQAIFSAYMDVPSGTTMQVKNLTIISNSTTAADAIINPSAGGASASKVAVKLNLGIAITSSVGDARLSGLGTLVATGDVRITATGASTAHAEVKGATLSINGITIAANLAYARVDARLLAAIESVNGQLNLQAKNVTVEAIFNTAKDTGATATIGSNGSRASVNISLIGGSSSNAYAKMTATVQAYIRGANITVPGLGAVSVTTNANTYAFATIFEPTASISLANVTLFFVKADAAGTFTSFIDTTNANLSVGTINVATVYTTKSSAITGPAGNASAAISGVSAKYNSADAKTSSKAQSYITGDGVVKTEGTINVLTTGQGSADAAGYTRSASISLAGLTVNIVHASLNANQSAFIANKGTIESGGTLTVDSLFGSLAEPGSATAQTGGSAAASNDDVELSLINGFANTATSESTVKSSASISGDSTGNAMQGSIRAGGVVVSANGYSSSIAQALNALGISLVSSGSLRALAQTHDTISATIIGTHVVTTTGDLAIKAINVTNAYALCEVPNTLTLIGGDGAYSWVTVGLAANRQTAIVTIGTNTSLDSARDLIIRAENHMTSRAEVLRGLAVSLTKLGDSTTGTVGYLDTRIVIGNGASLNAKGSISLVSLDNPRATSIVVGAQIAILMNANVMYAQNALDTLNSVSIGKNASVKAGKSLSTKVDSNGVLYAETDSTSGGWFSGDYLRAFNNLRRNAQINVGDGAQLSADFGDLSLIVEGGTSDFVTTRASTVGGGFIVLSDVRITTSVTTAATINIGAGVSIVDTFNTITIYANAALYNLSAEASGNNSGFGVSPDARTTVSVDLTPEILINGTDSQKTTITAANIDMRSYIGNMQVYAYAYGRSASFGAKVTAKADLTVYVDPAVTLHGVILRGYDTVNVSAEIRPSSWRGSLYVRSYTLIWSLGDVDSKAKIEGRLSNKVTIDKGSTIFGAAVTIATPASTLAVAGKSDVGGITLESPDASISLARNTSTTIAQDTVFYIGDAIAGIIIDVYTADNGLAAVRNVGLKKNMTSWVIAGDTITFVAISNQLPGSLNVSGSRSNNTYTIFTQNLLDGVTIKNHTSYDIILNAITLENANYLNPTVSGLRAVFSRNQLNPDISVINYAGGDVRINGLIANVAGSVNFVWEHEDPANTDEVARGDLYASRELLLSTGGIDRIAPIWANELTVCNAKNIGTSDVALNLWLMRGNGTSSLLVPRTNILVSGDIYLTLTEVAYLLVSSLPSEDNADTSALDGTISIAGIHSQGGFVDLTIGTAMRLYRLSNSATVSLPLPGTLEYMQESIFNLTTDVVIEREALARYLQGYNPADGTYTYLLPNGSVLYTSGDGTVVRIIEGGIDFLISDYSFYYDENNDNHPTVTLGVGVTLDLSTGYLTLQDGYSFDTLLSTVDASWLIAQLKTGNFQFVTISESIVDGVTIRTTTPLTFTTLYVDSPWTYYQVGPTKPSISTRSISYLVAYNSQEEVFKAYAFDSTTAGEGNNSTSDWVNWSYFDLNKGTLDDGTQIYDEIWGSGNFLGYLLIRGKEVQRGTDETRGDWIKFDQTYLRSPYGHSNYIYHSNFAGTGYTVVSNLSGTAWYWDEGQTSLDVRAMRDANNKIIYYISADATSNNPSIQAFYNKAAGLYWQAEASNAPLPITIFSQNGEDDSDENRRSVTYSNGEIPVVEIYEWREKQSNIYSYTTLSFKKYSVRYSFVWLKAMNLELTTTVITPETSTTPAKYGTVLRFTEETPVAAGTRALDAPSTLSLYGPLVDSSSVLIKQTSIPSAIPALYRGTATTAYRMTDTLYVTADGLFMMIDMNDEGTAADYIGTFRYHAITGGDLLTTMIRIDDVAVSTSDITLRSGQSIYLERLSDTVAFDMCGNYYFFANDTRYSAVFATDANVGHTTLYYVDGAWTPNKPPQEVDVPEPQSVEVNVETYYVRYEGNRVLTVKLYRTGARTRTGNLIPADYCDPDIVLIELVLSGANEGTTVDSFGVVTPSAQSVEVQRAFASKGSTYAINDIVGKTMQLTFEDPTGKLIDNAPEGAAALTTDELVVVTPAGSTIGTAEKPLSTAPYTSGGTTNLSFRELGDAAELNRIVSDISLKTSGSVVLARDLVIAATGRYHHEATEDIIYYNIDMEDAAYLRLIAGRDVIGTWLDEAAAIEGHLNAGKGAHALLEAARYNRFMNIKLAQDATLLVKGDAGITGGLLKGANGDDITFSSNGDINAIDNYLIVDIPQSVVFKITQVANYYLQAKDTAAPLPTIVTGRDVSGDEKTGERVGDDELQDIERVIVGSTTAELTAWISERIGEMRDEVSGRVDALSFATLLETLIKAADTRITAAWLAGLISDELWTEQRIQAVIDDLLAPAPGPDPDPDPAPDPDPDPAPDPDPDPDPDPLPAPDTLADVTGALIDAIAARVPVLDETGAPLLDENGIPVLAYRLANEKFSEFLGFLLDEKQMSDTAGLLTTIITPEEIAKALEKIWDEAAYPTTEPIDEPARAFNIHVGESTGSAYVNNEGSITITQDTGELTVGRIESARGDVELIALGGSIFANASEKIHVTAAKIKLQARDSIGSNATPLIIETFVQELLPVGNLTAPQAVLDPVTGDVSYTNIRIEQDVLTGEWKLVNTITYSWIRQFSREAASRLDADAQTGGIVIIENTGDLGLGVIKAGLSVGLGAPGSFFDVREVGETQPNVTAGMGMSALQSLTGTIGTLDKPICTALSSSMVAVDTILLLASHGDININNTGFLVAIVSQETGQVNVYNTGTLLIISSESRPLVLGTIVATEDVSISAPSDITAGTTKAHATITGRLISLASTSGSIGSINNRLTVDSGVGGGVSATAAYGDIFLVEVDGDLVLYTVRAGGDAALAAYNGAIRDVDDSDALTQAAALLKAALAWEAAARSADESAAIRSDKLDILKAAFDAAQIALNAAIAQRETSSDNLASLPTAYSNYDAALDDVTQAENDLVTAREKNALATGDDVAAIRAAVALELGISEADVTQEMIDAFILAAAQGLLDATQAYSDANEALATALANLKNLFDGDFPAEGISYTYDDLEALLKARLDAATSRETAALSKRDETKVAYESFKSLVDPYTKAAADARTQASKARAEYDTLMASLTSPTLDIEGDLVLVGTSVGSITNLLSVSVGGTLYVQAYDASTKVFGDVGIESYDGLVLNPLRARNVKLVVNGNIVFAPDWEIEAREKGAISGITEAEFDSFDLAKLLRVFGLTSDVMADTLDISAIGGSIGSAGAPLKTSVGVLSALGDEIHLTNAGSLLLGQVVATKVIDLRVGGDLLDAPDAGSSTPGDAGSNIPSIIAPRAQLDVAGTAGTSGNRLVMNVDELSLDAQAAYLKSLAPTLRVNDVTTDRETDILATGNVGGGVIDAADLRIGADGAIGSKDDPLVINVPGDVALTSVFKTVNYRNLYSTADDGFARTGDEGTTLLFAFLLLVGAAGMLVLSRRLRVRG